MSVDWIYHFGSSVDDIYRFNYPWAMKMVLVTSLAAPNKNTGEFFDMYMGIGGVNSC